MVLFGTAGLQLHQTHAEEMSVLDRAGGRALEGEDPGGPAGRRVRVVDPDHDLLVHGRDDPDAVLAGAADRQIGLVRVLGPGHARRLRQAGRNPDARSGDPGPARHDLVADQLDRLERLPAALRLGRPEAHGKRPSRVLMRRVVPSTVQDSIAPPALRRFIASHSTGPRARQVSRISATPAARSTITR